MHLEISAARRAGAAVASALTVLAVTAAAAGASQLPVIPIYSGPPTHRSLQVRPGSIIYTEDGSGAIAGSGPTVRRAGHLRWLSYGPRAASATGKDWRDNCRPDCAGGHFTGYPVRLWAYRPRRLDGRLVFTRVTVSYTEQTPPRRQYIVLHYLRLDYFDGSYNWLF